MKKINLRVWIIAQAVSTLYIPFFALAIIKKIPILWVLLGLAVLIIPEHFIKKKVEESMDERALEIRNRLQNKMIGAFEGLCIYGGTYMLILRYRVDWYDKYNISYLMYMMHTIGMIMLIAIPAIYIIYAISFIIKDKE